MITSDDGYLLRAKTSKTTLYRMRNCRACEAKIQLGRPRLTVRVTDVVDVAPPDIALSLKKPTILSSKRQKNAIQVRVDSVVPDDYTVVMSTRHKHPSGPNDFDPMSKAHRVECRINGLS